MEEGSEKPPICLEDDEPDRESSPVYSISGMHKELRQAEILSNVAQYIYNPTSGRVKEVYHKYTILASQDCDLLWDYKAAQNANGKAELNEILLFQAWEEIEIKPTLPDSSKTWHSITQNKLDRYGFLEAVPPNLDLSGQGLPALTVDFKRFFSIPPAELYRQCGLMHGAMRRCRLESPYKEHFQTRAGYYFQRVGLPMRHRKG